MSKHWKSIFCLMFVLVLIALAVMAQDVYNFKCEQLGWKDARFTRDGVLCHDAADYYADLKGLQATANRKLLEVQECPSCSDNAIDLPYDEMRG